MATDIARLSRASQTIKEAESAIRRYRFHFSNEAELRDGLAQVLGDEWQAEYILSQEDRADLFHEESGVVIETKIDQGLTPLTRQVHRYLQREEVTGIIVVTSKMNLGNLPKKISGKPVSVITLIGSIL